MELRRRVLEPVGGFSEGLGFYLSQMDEVRVQLKKAAEDLTEEELAKRILPEANQIGALILHIGEAEWGWIQYIVAGKEEDEESKRRFHLYDTIETDFALKGYTTNDCFKVIDEVSTLSRGFLSTFSDAALDKTIVHENETRRLETNLRWILHHLIDHESQHLGQIMMLKRLMLGA